MKVFMTMYNIYVNKPAIVSPLGLELLWYLHIGINII